MRRDEEGNIVNRTILGTRDIYESRLSVEKDMFKMKRDTFRKQREVTQDQTPMQKSNLKMNDRASKNM